MKAAQAAAAAAKKAEGGEGAADGDAAATENGAVDALEAAESAAFERVMGLVSDRAPVAAKEAPAPGGDAAAAAANDFLSSLKDEGHSRGPEGGSRAEDRREGWELGKRLSGLGWPARRCAYNICGPKKDCNLGVPACLPCLSSL